MIAKIEITLNKSKDQFVEFLKSNIVTLSHKSIIGSVETTADWKKIDNPDNFKFQLNFGLGPIAPWWGKCSLKTIEKGSKTTLSILILPPIIFLFFLGIMFIAIIYTIASIGMHNYGKPEFLISIMVPTILFGLVLLIWQLIAKYNAKKIRKDIITSFNEQLAREENAT